MSVFSVTEAMVSWISALGYRVSTRVPPDMPDEFVTVERVGGGMRSWVDHASMAVQVWAESDARAEELANALRLALATGQPPAGVHSAREETGPYPFYDESTGRARYQFVLAVSCQLETSQ